MRRMRGQALVMAAVVVGLFTILGGSLLTRSMSGMQQATLQQLYAEVFYLAQGGLEDTIGQFADALANFQVSATASQYPASGTLTTTFSQTATLPSGATASSVMTELAPGQQLLIDPDGTQALVKTYHVTTTVQHPLKPGVRVALHQVINRRLVYTFQHTVFYEDDLEILPGPAMTLTGRLHTNSDLYLGANDELRINSEYARAAGHIFNKRKDVAITPPGDVSIKKSGTGAFFDMNGLDSPDPTWVPDSQQRWNGTVQDSAHGVTQLAVPVVGSIQPGGYYDQQAGLRIVNGVVYQGSSQLVPGLHIPSGTVTVTTSFYNNREGKYVQMYNVDLKKLAGYANCDADPEDELCFPNRLPGNGLMYVTTDGVPSSYQPGVRLLNGQQIHRSGGLTVVTNDPLYLQGNYNTLNKQPCAVMADALNLLSTNWNDSTSAQSLSNRVAANTTVNAAFLAGIKTTSAGVYNGGLENYPRLHENWTGKTLTIRGSFVALWNSQLAIGAWQYGAPQYTAPNRNWDYDTDFSSSPPPFTPWAVEIQREAWWRE